MRVAVIGGGAAGLTTLKHLLEGERRFTNERLEVRLFEREASVGGTFQYRTYEDGELVSSRFLTAFSDFRISEDSPDFISTVAYCQYLRDYCTHFDLWSRIELETTVHNITRHEKGGHVVRLSKNGSSEQEQWHCDAIAVCSGLNVTPNIPEIKGLEYVPEAFHSSSFKKRKQFGEGKHVLVLGAGETAMDIGHLAVTSPTRTVTLSHRGGWKHSPKKLPDPINFGNEEKLLKDIQRNGVAPPTDTGFASLFDTAYIHPALERSPLPWDYYDKFTWFYAWYTTGTGTGIDQYAGEIRGDRHHASRAVAMKSNKTQTYISAPYRPKNPSVIERIRAYVCTLPPVDTKGRHIDLAPWPDYIDEEGVVHFKDNGRPEYEMIKNKTCKPDIIVYATGYTQVFPFFDESYPTIFDADIRRIWKTGVEDVGFIGFVRPSFGAIPPLAELQAQLFVMNLFDRLPKRLRVNENYMLKSDPERRLDYIVDHEAYAYRLACDMGAASSFFQVLSFGWIVFLTWALGPNFNTKFRLTGPWQWDGAASIMKGEQWTVIKRRKGFLIWTCMSILPLTLFGVLSLLFYIAYGLKDAFVWLFLSSKLNEQKSSLKPIRGSDPSGVKKARAMRDAHGPKCVVRY